MSEPQEVRVILDELSTPTADEAYTAVREYDTRDVVAAVASKACAPGGGSGSSFEHVVVPIAFDTPGLVIPASGPAGIKVTDLAVGDRLISVDNMFIVSVTTAWDGNAPTLQLCLEEDRGDMPGTEPVSETDADLALVDSDVTPNSTGTIVNPQNITAFEKTVRCVAPTGLYVYVDDGSLGDPGSTQGEGAVEFYIVRAPA